MDNIRSVSEQLISDTVKELFIKANYELPDKVCSVIADAREKESNSVAASVLGTLQDNTEASRRLQVPICQDTGMAVLFCDIGRGVYIDGSFNSAVNDGVHRAYVEGLLRKSIVRDPLYDRKNTEDNTPALVHIRFSDDDELVGKIRLTAAPKGFGSENMSSLKMMTPSATEEDIVAFAVDSVRRAGANPCPPIFVGIGIGGNFEGVALLAKRALIRDDPSGDSRYRALEERILCEVNKIGIGPQGFGGDTTALAVRIEAAPTHIAGLPVAVNINCHVSRHVTAVI